MSQEWRRVVREGLLASCLLILWPSGAAAQPTGGDVLIQEADLTPPDLAPGDRYGRGVFLSADGSTAFVVAGGADCHGGDNCGAVYVFSRGAGGVWVQEARLTAPDAAASAFFGTSVATSPDGDVVLIGAPGRTCAEGINCGAVYVFARAADGVWMHQQTFVSSDLRATDRFGWAIAMAGDGNQALVGAFSARCGSSVLCGAVYVFTRTGSSWTEAGKFDKNVPGIAFGAALALSRDGNTALVLANFFGLIAGRVFVFRRSGGIWIEEAQIDSPAACDFSFGGALDISDDGETALISGAVCGSFPTQGRAFVYTRQGGAWPQQAELTVAEQPLSQLLSLAGDGDLALVGVRGSACASPGPGDGTVSVLFARTGGTWSVRQRLALDDPSAATFFSAVDLSADGQVALVGLASNCAGSVNTDGAAFAFASPASVPGIPALSGPGLLALALALAGGGALLLRRHAHA